MSGDSISVNVNPYLWMSMGPYAWSSHYGYELQLNVLPEFFSPQEAKLFHGILNPNHVSQWNPLFSVPFDNNITNPYLTEKGLEAAKEWGINTFETALRGIKFNESTQKISQIKGQFSALIKDKNLNDAQKAKLQEIIDEATAIQKRLTEYQKKIQKKDADKKALNAEFEQINEDIQTLHDKATTVVEKIKEELEGTANPDDEDPNGVEDPDGTENTPGTENAPGTENTPGSQNTPGTQNAQTSNQPQAANTSKIAGDPGPNNTIVKDGKYYSPDDGTKLNPQYALGTEMKLKDGYSVRVWANGENVVYRDSNGKQIMDPKEFIKKYPDEYIKIMKQQFTNALPENAGNISFKKQTNSNGELETIEFTYNDKRVNAKVPVDVKKVLEKLGVKTQKA